MLSLESKYYLAMVKFAAMSPQMQQDIFEYFRDCDMQICCCCTKPKHIAKVDHYFCYFCQQNWNRLVKVQ